MKIKTIIERIGIFIFSLLGIWISIVLVVLLWESLVKVFSLVSSFLGCSPDSAYSFVFLFMVTIVVASFLTEIFIDISKEKKQ